MSKLKSIFQDVPEDIDETWRHVAIYGGWVGSATSQFELAQHFKRCGDILANGVPNQEEAYVVFAPVLYMYRHSIELYFKSVVTKWGHSLKSLLKEFERVVFDKFGEKLPEWFKSYVLELHEIDKKSTTFRYTEGSPIPSHEYIVDFRNLVMVMNKVSNVFHIVYHEINKAS